jgi:hypothetical protein
MMEETDKDTKFSMMLEFSLWIVYTVGYLVYRKNPEDTLTGVIFLLPCLSDVARYFYMSDSRWSFLEVVNTIGAIGSAIGIVLIVLDNIFPDVMAAGSVPRQCMVLIPYIYPLRSLSIAIFCFLRLHRNRKEESNDVDR